MKCQEHLSYRCSVTANFTLNERKSKSDAKLLNIAPNGVLVVRYVGNSESYFVLED
jgi:hypothetical protein